MESMRENSYMSDPQNRNDILSKLDFSDEIDKLKYSMMGLKKVKYVQEGKTYIKTIREGKPTFTESFVILLINDITKFLSRNMQVSSFDKNRVDIIIHQYIDSLGVLISTKGEDSYISNKMWAQILRVYEAKSQYKNGWASIGIDWDINQPVPDRILEYVYDPVKDDDQAAEYMTICITVDAMLQASMNKSVSKVMLDALSNITRVSTIQKDDGKKKGLNLFSRQQEDEVY